MTSKAANLRRDQFTFELRTEYVIDACEIRARGLFLCDWGSTRERDSETFRLKHACSSPAFLSLIMISTYSLVAWFRFGHPVHRW